MTNDNRMDVFDVVRKYVDSTQYVVIPKTRIKDELQGKYTQEETDASLTVLQLNGLLIVGFSDSECYCLALTQKGIREGELRDMAKEEEARLALAAKERASEKQLPPTLPQEEETEEEEKTESFSLGKKERLNLALLCGGSAFLGALLAGIITMIVVLVKVG